MKVKTGPSKPKPFKKTPSGAIQKKKFSKPTGGALKNIVKITDAFEDLKSGADLIGISCSKEPKADKKPKSEKKDTVSKETVKNAAKVPKNSVGVKKNSKKLAVPPKQKLPKKEKIDGAPKISLKSRVLASKQTAEVNTNESEPKLDITKVNFE